jgi:hypothetical protein
MNGPAKPDGFHLLDVAAVVAGYGMASLLVRAFWPSGQRPPLAEIVVIGLFFTWLGLAMSGPLVLLVHRPAPRLLGGDEPGEAATAPAGTRTWAELAWLIIGFYWIGLTVLVVPVRLNRSPLQDAAMLSVFPIAAALVLRFFDRGSRRARANPETPAWTHRAAIGLLCTWPLAWFALILLGKNLL